MIPTTVAAAAAATTTTTTTIATTASVIYRRAHRFPQCATAALATTTSSLIVARGCCTSSSSGGSGHSQQPHPHPVSASAAGRLSRRRLVLGPLGIATAAAAFLSTSSASPSSPLSSTHRGVMAFASSAAAAAADGGRMDAQKILDDLTWPEEWPFSESDFERYDESNDAEFYSSPRFVTHIDDPAIGALQQWYSKHLPESGSDASVLDICSSWISHYPKDYAVKRVSGLGMNEAELKRNPVLSDFVVHDLNTDPRLPYDDNSFDFITNTVSVDYMNRPRELFKEILRVLKPGGSAAMSFSNRCFPTKAVNIWGRVGDKEHIVIVGAYFHYTPGFGRVMAEDISPNPMLTDPMYVVYASKQGPDQGGGGEESSSREDL